MIIDAKNLILGRLGALVAKKVLLGEEIRIVNCKDAVVVGRKEVILNEYRARAERTTPVKGPFIPKTTDRFVKRSIRGMLPYKQEKGRSAYKRIRCFKSIPETLKNEKMESLDRLNVLKTRNVNFVKVADICKHLGGK